MQKIISCSLLGLIIDQIIKIVINSQMILNTSITIISNFFHITYVHNYGAAWSIFNGQRIFLVLIAVVTLISLYIFFLKDKDINKYEQISYGLIIGGILGNLLDRIIYGYVIDYLDFNIFGYNFPIFNIADILITVGAFLMIIEIIRGNKVNERN